MISSKQKNDDRVRRRLIYKENGIAKSGAVFAKLPSNEATYMKNTPLNHFVFCLKGKVRINTRYYWDEFMTENQMAFVPAGYGLHLKAFEDSEILIISTSSLFIGCNGELMEYIRKNTDRKVDFLPVDENVRELVSHIAMEVANAKIQIAKVCESWVMQLMITLEAYYSREDLAAFLCRAVKPKVDIRTFVMNNYRKVDRKASVLSSLYGVSQPVFYRLFREEFGMSVNDWLIQQTKDDLMKNAAIPGITTNELAYTMKMTTIRLCQFTKKHLGRTPSELIDRK